MSRQPASRTSRKPASRPALRVVRRKKHGLIKRSRSRKIAPAVVLLGILFAATIATILLEQVVLAQSAFKLAGMRQELELAEEKHSQLLLEAAKLGSSERIKRVATQQLGMVYPQEAGGLKYIVANVRSTWSNQIASTVRPGAGSAGDDGIAAGDAVLGAESP